MDLAKKHIMLSGQVPIEFSCFQQDVHDHFFTPLKKAPFNRNILPQDVKTKTNTPRISIK
jgi:hypothetical protein